MMIGSICRLPVTVPAGLALLIYGCLPLTVAADEEFDRIMREVKQDVQEQQRADEQAARQQENIQRQLDQLDQQSRQA